MKQVNWVVVDETGRVLVGPLEIIQILAAPDPNTKYTRLRKTQAEELVEDFVQPIAVAGLVTGGYIALMVVLAASMAAAMVDRVLGTSLRDRLDKFATGDPFDVRLD